jgi:hypothetical protein
MIVLIFICRKINSVFSLVLLINSMIKVETLLLGIKEIDSDNITLSNLFNLLNEILINHIWYEYKKYGCILLGWCDEYEWEEKCMD